MCSSEVGGLLKENALYLVGELGVDNSPLDGWGGSKDEIYKTVSR
jgi:hypothetical protein